MPFTSYAVEVLPAFKMSSNYWYPDTNSGGAWRTADPQAELTALRGSNSLTGGKTIHLIKMLKAWRHERNVSIKSFVLELLAVDFLRQWGYNRTGETYTSYGYYDFMLRDFCPFLLAKENGYVSIPGTGQLLSLGNAWRHRRDSQPMLHRGPRITATQTDLNQLRPSGATSSGISSPENRAMTDELLAVTREEYGRVAYTHKAQEKAVERVSRTVWWQRTVNAALLTITAGATIDVLARDEKVSKVVGLIFSAAALFLAIYTLARTARSCLTSIGLLHGHSGCCGSSTFTSSETSVLAR